MLLAADVQRPAAHPSLADAHGGGHASLPCGNQELPSAQLPRGSGSEHKLVSPPSETLGRPISAAVGVGGGRHGWHHGRSCNTLSPGPSSLARGCGSVSLNPKRSVQMMAPTSCPSASGRGNSFHGGSKLRRLELFLKTCSFSLFDTEKQLFLPCIKIHLCFRTTRVDSVFQPEP